MTLYNGFMKVNYLKRELKQFNEGVGAGFNIYKLLYRIQFFFPVHEANKNVY